MSDQWYLPQHPVIQLLDQQQEMLLTQLFHSSRFLNLDWLEVLFGGGYLFSNTSTVC